MLSGVSDYGTVGFGSCSFLDCLHPTKAQHKDLGEKVAENHFPVDN